MTNTLEPRRRYDDIRQYLGDPPPPPRGLHLLIRFAAPIPPGVGTLMTENALLTTGLWSATLIAGVWLLGFFVRPALDWWYRDVDTFAELLPAVEALQELRMNQLRLIYHRTDDPTAAEDVEREAATSAATIRDRLTELRTRLRALHIVVPDQRWLTDAGDESEAPVDSTLAVLRGQMQDRGLRSAKFWALAMRTDSREA